jgi:hypothetical protein
MSDVSGEASASRPITACDDGSAVGRRRALRERLDDGDPDRLGVLDLPAGLRREERVLPQGGVAAARADAEQDRLRRGRADVEPDDHLTGWARWGVATP